MNAEETLKQLTASLAQSLQQLAEKRNDCDSGVKYAELTGRMDTMTSIINFLQQSGQAVVPAPEAEPKATGKKVKRGKKAAKSAGAETK